MLLITLVLWPFAAGLLAALLGAKSARARDGFVPLAALLELALAALLCAQAVRGQTLSWSSALCGAGLELTADGFRALWAAAAAFAWLCACAMAPAYLAHDGHSNRYHLFTFLTLGGVMGVFLAGTLYTLFVFFEIMSLASWVWVAHEDGGKARYAADTYLAVAVIGGLVLLMGLFLLEHLAGTLEISRLAAAAAAHDGEAGWYVTGALLLLGFGAKAGMFPLHFWLPMAHPVAPAPASALLSGVLTKCGVFGVLLLAANLFPHDLRWGEAVLGLGTVTMVLGALLALFAVDLKRTLACSSVSQIGFILVGCALLSLLGEGHGLAAAGVQLHMLNHLLIKTTLFLAAGVFAMNCHTLDLNALRGAGKNSPLILKLSFLISGISVAGVPLTSGYVSKTLLHEGIVEYIAHAEQFAGMTLAPLHIIEWLFLLSGGMTLAYMAKLFYLLFLAKPAQAGAPLKMGKLTAFAAGAPALILLILGLTPHQTMDRLAGEGMLLPGLHASKHAVQYLSLGNLKGAAISIGIGVILYTFIIRKCLMRGGALQNAWPAWLDLERRVYRPVVLRLLPFLTGCVCRCLDYLMDGIITLLRVTILRSVGPGRRPLTRYWLADHLGPLLDRIARRKGHAHRSFVFSLAEWQEETAITSRLIGASLSFGLLMFCIGLTLTLVYLLV